MITGHISNAATITTPTDFRRFIILLGVLQTTIIVQICTNILSNLDRVYMTGRIGPLNNNLLKHDDLEMGKEEERRRGEYFHMVWHYVLAILGGPLLIIAQSMVGIHPT
mmetsp:Transcript_136034/g.235981  ORF Transcript_136034/g.235981 Transcript_136034/m.235981 type:complete len:109 (-) Transcript_136034:1165-1491(-)